jgi:plastocyanin
MSNISNQTASMLLIAAGFLSLCTMQFNVKAAQTKPKTPAGQKTGTIEGTVTYTPDTSRPWRYARFYVKNRREGQLAEAVVALSKRGLNKVTPAGRPTTTVVDQKNFQFTPETVAIRAASRVKFLNSDNELHNVLMHHPLQSVNVNMPSGGEHIETFKRAGGISRPYKLGCVFHSAMRGWVFVFDHPFFHVTKTDGHFRLINVPPGEYKLQMVHSAGQLSWSRTIKVQSGKTTRVDVHVSPDNKSKNGSDGEKK